AALAAVSVAVLPIALQTRAGLYAEAAGGVIKSTSSGGSGSAVNSDVKTESSVLAIDPQTPTTLYAGGTVLSKSTNGGGSWSNLGFQYLSVYALAIDPLMPTTPYAGTNSGVAKSHNGGGSESGITFTSDMRS